MNNEYEELDVRKRKRINEKTEQRNAFLNER